VITELATDYRRRRALEAAAQAEFDAAGCVAQTERARAARVGLALASTVAWAAFRAWDSALWADMVAQETR
jgi:hypothetical protein